MKVDAVFFDEGSATVKLTVRVHPPRQLKGDSQFDHRPMATALREWLDAYEDEGSDT